MVSGAVPELLDHDQLFVRCNRNHIHPVNTFQNEEIVLLASPGGAADVRSNFEDTIISNPFGTDPGPSLNHESGTLAAPCRKRKDIVNLAAMQIPSSTPRLVRWGVSLALLGLLAIGGSPTAVPVLFDGDPNYNTSAPTGLLSGSRLGFARILGRISRHAGQCALLLERAAYWRGRWSAVCLPRRHLYDHGAL